MIKVFLYLNGESKHFCFLPEKYEPLLEAVKARQGISDFILEKYFEEFGDQGLMLSTQEIKNDIVLSMAARYPELDIGTTYDRFGFTRLWLIEKLEGENDSSS